MKSISGLSSALCLAAIAASAQETSEIEQIRRQLQEANEAFRKAMEQYQKSTDALNKRLEQIQGRGLAGADTAAIAQAYDDAKAFLRKYLAAK